MYDLYDRKNDQTLFHAEPTNAESGLQAPRKQNKLAKRRSQTIGVKQPKNLEKAIEIPMFVWFRPFVSFETGKQPAGMESSLTTV